VGGPPFIAQKFDLEGAPSFAFFAKGWVRDCRHRQLRFAFDARSLFVPVTMQRNSRSAFDSPSLALGVRSGQALDFAQDDNGWGVLNLQGQNPHPNFAKNAKLGWGTLAGWAWFGRWCCTQAQGPRSTSLRAGSPLRLLCFASVGMTGFGSSSGAWWVRLSIGKNYANGGIVVQRWEI